MAARKKKATAVASEELTIKLTTLRQQAQAMLEACTNVDLSAQEGIDEADRKLSIVHQALKALEDDKEKTTSPLRAELDGQRSLYRPIEECLQSCKDSLKRKIIERVESNNAAIDEAARGGATSILPVLISKVVATEEYWACEVIDEEQVPGAYWLLDSKGLDIQADREREAFSVPGCRAVRRVRGRMVG